MDEKKILKLIAEGYFNCVHGDRWIFLDNPKYRDGTIDGESEDEYIVWDTWYGEENEG
jgi:hypothetical protein